MKGWFNITEDFSNAYDVGFIIIKLSIHDVRKKKIFYSLG